MTIDKQKTAWILCTEKLPDPDVEVFIRWTEIGMTFYGTDFIDSSTGQWDGVQIGNNPYVESWMPIPE